MPNLNEFLNKKEVESKQINTTFEELSGIRACSQCNEDVVGGLWDPDGRVMYWTCSAGHENKFEVD
jgi:hypothetical protein